MNTIDEKLNQYFSLKKEIQKQQTILDNMKADIQSELEEKNILTYKNSFASLSYVKPFHKMVLDTERLAREKGKLYEELLREYGIPKVTGCYWRFKELDR